MALRSRSAGEFVVLKEKSPSGAERIEELREQVAIGCRVLARAGLVESILGHVSARVDEGRMLIRGRGPWDRGLRFTEPRDVQLVDFDGEGDDLPDGWQVPKELPIHGSAYRRRPEVRSVVHAHPPAALIAGLAALEIRPVFGAFNIPALNLARAGVPVYPRSVLVTRRELGDEVFDCMGDRDVCLMIGHGVTVVGSSVPAAIVRALDLDQLIRVTRELALLGVDPPEVPADDLAELPDLGSAFNELAVWRHLCAVDAAERDCGVRVG